MGSEKKKVLKIEELHQMNPSTSFSNAGDIFSVFFMYNKTTDIIS